MKLLEECKQAKRIGISGHIRPDGDCVGSCMGLYLYLKKVRPDAHIRVFLEKPADIFRCIRGVEEINSDFGEQEAFDVFFCLDTAADRLGGADSDNFTFLRSGSQNCAEEKVPCCLYEGWYGDIRFPEYCGGPQIPDELRKLQNRKRNA